MWVFRCMSYSLPIQGQIKNFENSKIPFFLREGAIILVISLSYSEYKFDIENIPHSLWENWFNNISNKWPGVFTNTKYKKNDLDHTWSRWGRRGGLSQKVILESYTNLLWSFGSSKLPPSEFSKITPSPPKIVCVITYGFDKN